MCITRKRRDAIFVIANTYADSPELNSYASYFTKLKQNTVELIVIFVINNMLYYN